MFFWANVITAYTIMKQYDGKLPSNREESQYKDNKIENTKQEK